MPSQTFIIPPTRNLIDEIVDKLDLSTNDLRRSLIVFPGKRPAHFLRKAIATRIGKSYLPPRIFSYDNFIEYLSAERLGISSQLLQPLDAAAILFETHKNAKERLGGKHFQSFDQFIGLGLKLFDELEEIRLADVPERRLEEIIGGLAYGRLHALKSYYQEFYRRVAERRYSTRATQLKLVAECLNDINLSSFGSVILAGFYALTNIDQRIFNGLAQRENVTFIFQQGPGLLRQMQKLDLEADEDVDGIPTPETFFYASPDSHGQILALAHHIKTLIEKGEALDERTVVVLPAAEALFPVIHQVLTLLPEEGHNISLGYPLERTPLYGFFNSLLEVVTSADGDRILASAYTKFVLHPYTKNIRYGARTDVTRTLFHAIEELLARRSSTTVSLDELESDNSLIERVVRGFEGEDASIARKRLQAHLKMIHDATIRKFMQVRSLKDFASNAIELVLFISTNSTANLHPLFHRYAEAMIELLENVKVSRAAEESFTDPVAFASFLRSYVGAQTAPFPGTPLRGLQVLGLLETRNLSFDRVFVLDVSDDVIPGARSSDMLLPQGLRENLGLETYHDREKLSEYYFQLLVSGAKEVHLFFTESDKKERSRFIQKMLWQQQRFVGQEQRKTDREGVRHIRYAIHLAVRSPGAIPKNAEVMEYLKRFEYTATSLDTYLKCPLKFYYRYVLDLKEKDEVAEDIDALDVGNLVHRALGQFFKPVIGSKLKKEDLDEARLERAVEEVFEKAYGANLKGSAYLVKRQVTEQLREFIQNYQLPLLTAQPIEILGVEQDVSVVKDEYVFSGRLDRIEHRGDEAYIIDYKISYDDKRYKIKWKKFDSENPETWADSIGSIQLPMYSLLYSEWAGLSAEKIVPMYLLLGKVSIDEKIESRLEPEDNARGSTHEALQKVIMALVREINNASIPFQPTEDQKSVCPECAYQAICGTQWAKKGRW